MTLKDDIENWQLKKKREFEFIPRIINPVKIRKAIILSADEQIRNSTKILNEYMPWIETKVLSDPISASNFKSKTATVLIFDDMALSFVDTTKIARNNKDVVLVLLTANSFIYCSPPSVAKAKFPYTAKADLIFAVNNHEFTPDHIISSVVRCAEDKLNIEKYSQARRYIFLIVDDEPRWCSQFLPVLYNIIGQRADVMVTRTYEETLEFLFGVSDESEIDEHHFQTTGYGDDVVCMITDIFFPKGTDLNSDAGRDLVKLIHRYYPRIPIIIASKAKEADDLRQMAFIMPKGDPGSLQTLHNYIHDYTGMGDFIIRNETGTEFYRIKNLSEMYDLLLKAEKNDYEGYNIRQLLDLYGQKDYFSTWLYMHGFRELGDKLRPKRDKGWRLVATLKRHLKREILRMKFTPLIIDNIKIFNLQELLNLLRTTKPTKIQKFSDNDLFSYWIDRKGYPELAEEIRPIHGSGNKLKKILATIIEKWVDIYQQRGRDVL